MCLDPPRPKAPANTTKTGSEMLAGTGVADAAAAGSATRALPTPKEVPVHNRALTIGYICIVVCDISELMPAAALFSDLAASTDATVDASKELCAQSRDESGKRSTDTLLGMCRCEEATAPLEKDEL